MRGLKEKLNWIIQGWRYLFAYSPLSMRTLLFVCLTMLFFFLTISIVGFIFHSYWWFIVTLETIFALSYGIYVTAYGGHMDKRCFDRERERREREHNTY